MADRRNDGRLKRTKLSNGEPRVSRSLSGGGQLSERAAAWDLETVKHLVVLNAAGLAGVATLFAGNKSLCPRWVGPIALLDYQ